jgi:hypothetical protein
MINSVFINRTTPRHADVVDVLEELGKGDYGSAVNAAVSIIRQSPLFTRTLKKLQKARAESQPEAAPSN